MKNHLLPPLLPALLLLFGPAALQAEEHIHWRNVHITMMDAASGKVVFSR